MKRLRKRTKVRMCMKQNVHYFETIVYEKEKE